MFKVISFVILAVYHRAFESPEYVGDEPKKRNAAVLKGASSLPKGKRAAGFSLIELIISMTITLILLGIIAVSFRGALNTRNRETSRTDALTAAQAAINVMSREISNAGYGLTNNGIVLADSNFKKLHIRANTKNDNLSTNDTDEDITYFHDIASKSVVRYDAHATPSTSGIINQISEVNFQYFDYTGASSNPVVSFTPSENTGRIRITLIVFMAGVEG